MEAVHTTALLACVVLVATVLCIYLRRLLNESRRVHRAISDLRESVFIMVKGAVVEMHSLAVLQDRFGTLSIPTSGYSMRFRNVHALIELLDEHAPTCICELGSGISTLYIAAWLRERSRGCLISVDHDESWATLASHYLSSTGLDAYARVVTAPLSTVNVPDHPEHAASWYDLEMLRALPRDIDVLVIDGPPNAGANSGLSRLPALPLLIDNLSPNAVVVLDDYSRRGEKETVRKWQSDYPLKTLSIVPSLSGMIMLQVQRARCVSAPAPAR